MIVQLKNYLIILWATPSAAGSRSLLIASGLQILGIVASGSWYFLARKLSFGMSGGFTLASWGPWADFGTLGNITKESLRSRRGFLQIFAEFWCPWVSFGMLGASTLPCWGTLGRSWDIREYKKGHCEVQAWILSVFG